MSALLREPASPAAATRLANLYRKLSTDLLQRRLASLEEELATGLGLTFERSKQEQAIDILRGILRRRKA